MSSSVGVDERLRFDVLILGAGSAGCVLASRLGEDGRR
jgi:choline dehydrogenase-like flavoprotein